jgi:hypothetical protein
LRCSEEGDKNVPRYVLLGGYTICRRIQCEAFQKYNTLRIESTDYISYE